MNKNTSALPTIPRRDFLVKSAISLGACTILPAYLTSARAADNPKLPPSRRINLACIGIGGQAGGVIPGLHGNGAAMPIAFADVDHVRGKKMIEKYPEAKVYHDFRIMLDEMGKDIDAVSVITPDHTHFVATILAMSMGKHVYTEKPLTHTFEEAEILMRAEKKFKVVTQMGNHGHTSSGAEQFKIMVSNGIISDIVKIEAWKSAGLWFMNSKDRISQYPSQEPMPQSLKSWELWCGPREVHPFSYKYHPFNWRAFYCYGGGMFGDWGAHIIDFAHDHLKLGLPTRIKAVQCFDHNSILYPRSSHITFQFPARGPGLPELVLDWKAGGDLKVPTADPKFAEVQNNGESKIPNLGGVGSFLHRKQNDYLISRGSHGAVSRIYPQKTMVEFGEKVKGKKPAYDHYQGFIEACKGNGTTESPFSKAGELTQVLILGTIAEYLNAELNFNPANKRFVGNDSANDLLVGAPPRAEWAGYYKLA